MSGYAFVHAGLQRADAYTAAEKMTKTDVDGNPRRRYVSRLGTNFIGLSITGSAIAAVAAGVYLVDVRPKVLEVQGKSR